MKFNRLALIARAEKLIAEAEQGAAERTEKAAQEAAARAPEYVAEYSAAWAEFATNIRAANRAKRPVTHADVPAPLTSRQMYGESLVKTFVPVEPQEFGPHDSYLRHFIAVLETVTDDEVTSSGLAAIGIRNIP